MTHRSDNPDVLTNTENGVSAPTPSPAHIASAHATPSIMDRLRQPYIASECPLSELRFRRLFQDNWLAWKMRMRIALQLWDAFEIVMDAIPKPDDPRAAAGWARRDMVAQHLIITNLRDEDLILIHGCNTAAEMWTAVKSVYEQVSQWPLRNTRRTRGKKKVVFRGG